MAKTILPTNFQDDIMNASMDGKRRYNVINNPDGTISLEDVTEYDQVGSNFGAGQINQTNTAVNEAADAGKIIDDLETVSAVTEKGYITGALAAKELKKSVADGKALIASAITSKGVSTAADAAFATMANNIKSIKTGYTIKSQTIKVWLSNTGSYTGTFGNLTRVDGISSMSQTTSIGSGRQRGFSWSISGNAITFNVIGESGTTDQTLTVTGFQIT